MGNGIVLLMVDEKILIIARCKKGICKDEIWPRRRLQSTYKCFQSSMCLLELSTCKLTKATESHSTAANKSSQQASKRCLSQRAV
jgi:hypothetical protein